MNAFNDLRLAIRMLRRAPLTTAAAVLSLAIGLGANLTIFGWIDALVYRPLSGVSSQHTLVVVDGLTSSGGDQRLSYPDVRDLQSRLTHVKGLLAYTYQPFGLSTGDHAERVWGQLVSANFFDVLGVSPALGRGFRPEEELEGTGPVAVISDTLWRRRFDARRDAVGKTIQVSGQNLTIIGVAPPAFHGVAVGLMLDIWVPLGMQPLVGGGQPNRLHARDLPWLGAYGRLADGVSVKTLQHELAAIGGQIAAEYPAAKEGTSFAAATLADAPWGGTTVMRPVLNVLAVVVVVLLVVTCANVANLLLVRIVERRREIAVRLSIGATRWQISRELLIEGLVLALLACAVAAGVATASTRLFDAFVPLTGFPIGFTLTVGGRWLALLAATCGVATVALGVAPILYAAAIPVARVLQQEGHAVIAGGGRARARRTLVGAQVALSVVALTTAGSLTKALTQLSAVDPGFDTRGVLLASVDLSQAGYTPTRGSELLRRLPESIGSLPGVHSVSFARRVPLNFGGRGLMAVSIDGHTPARGEDVSLSVNHVGPGYLRTMGIGLVDGREFMPSDNDSAPRVAIVSRRAVDRYWKDHRVLGTELTISGERVRIIGVSADILQDGLAAQPPPSILLPLLQFYRPDVVLHVATAGDPAALATPLRQLIARIEPSLPVYDLRTMTDHMQVPTFPYRLSASLALGFGVVALLLAMLGLYAAMAHGVAERRSEVGLRLALGASRASIATLVSRSGAAIVGAGGLLGLLLALGAAEFIGTRLTGVDFRDTATIGTALGSVIAISAVAILPAAWRAVATSPARALRQK